MAVHDLRAPLRAIRLGAQLVLNDGHEPSAENTTRGARYLLEGADRMEVLISDLAEYCYEETREPVLGETMLEDVLQQVKKDLAGEIRSTGAVITNDALPSVIGDFESLVIVLRCVIGNSCKFRGDATPSIHVGATQRGKEWTVLVQDNGVGFDKVYRERIFRPFERLNGRQYPGSGLGLTLARKIIGRHGGDIWAESSPGEGSTFRFTLPAAGE